MKVKNILKEFRGIFLAIIISLLVVSIINTKVFAIAKVQQSSMENTLYNDEKLIVDKLTYNFVEAKRGDIIIFLKDEEKGSLLEESYNFIKEIVSFRDVSNTRTRYIKRVIGIEGDEINIYGGYVYVNGEKLDEEYIKGKTYSSEIEFPVVVKENELFVLGDNREGSMDSRHFGVININQVEGKAFFRIFPLNRYGSLK